MALTLYKSCDPNKLYLINNIKNDTKHAPSYYNVCLEDSDINHLRFLTPNKIIIAPNIYKHNEHASIIDFNLETNVFDIYNANTPTMLEIIEKLGAHVDPYSIQINVHGKHDNRIILGYRISDSSTGEWKTRYYIVVYDYIMNQVIDMFENEHVLYPGSHDTYYNDKMRYFIYRSCAGGFYIRNINNNITIWNNTYGSLRNENNDDNLENKIYTKLSFSALGLMYTEMILVFDNKSSYIYLIYCNFKKDILKIVGVSLTSLKTIAVNFSDTNIKHIFSLSRVTFKDNYLIIGDGWNYCVIYMNKSRIEVCQEINKIISKNAYKFVKIENELLYMTGRKLYDIYNIKTTKLESYNFELNPNIYSRLECGVMTRFNMQELIGTKVYITISEFETDFCYATGKLFLEPDDLLKFFKKNKSVFGRLIHGNHFEKGILRLIINYI